MVNYPHIIGGQQGWCRGPPWSNPPLTECQKRPWYVSNVSIIFYCSMLLYYHSWMFYNHFIATLYHFLVLMYWHSAQWQLLFSACFLHRRKSIPNRVQTQRKFLWIFLDQKTSSGPRKYLRRASRGSQPTRARLVAQVRLGGLCPPRWPPAPPLCSINTPIFQKS